MISDIYVSYLAEKYPKWRHRHWNKGYQDDHLNSNNYTHNTNALSKGGQSWLHLLLLRLGSSEVSLMTLWWHQSSFRQWLTGAVQAQKERKENVKRDRSILHSSLDPIRVVSSVTSIMDSTWPITPIHSDEPEKYLSKTHSSFAQRPNLVFHNNDALACTSSLIHWSTMIWLNRLNQGNLHMLISSICKV